MKKDSKVELIMHPVRMKIIQSLISKSLSVQQMSELLPEVPQATLYRHLNRLLKAEIVQVVEEKQVRGAVEKIYSLSEHSGQLIGEEAAQATPEEHYQYFFTFITNVLADFENYLSQSEFDLQKDGVSYRQASLYLSDEEFTQLMTTIGTAIFAATKNDPAAGRKRRTITTIVIPQADNRGKGV